MHNVKVDWSPFEGRGELWDTFGVTGAFCRVWGHCVILCHWQSIQQKTPSPLNVSLIYICTQRNLSSGWRFSCRFGRWHTSRRHRKHRCLSCRLDSANLPLSLPSQLAERHLKRARSSSSRSKVVKCITVLTVTGRAAHHLRR